MKRLAPFHWFVAGLLYLFLYAPIAVVMVYSFNTARYGSNWQGFTFQWYVRLWDNEPAMSAALNTVILAVTSTLIATGLGTLLGFGLSRYRFPGRKAFAWLMYIPVFIPDIVMAVALLMFYAFVRSWLGLFELGLPTMIVAHVTFQIPFVAVIVRSRLAGLDPAVEEAAHDLGADAWQTFRHVTLPRIWPGMVAGGMLAFTLSLDDFVISFFTSGPGSTTLPILIYSSVKRGVTPEINALATLVVVASIMAVIALRWLHGGENNRS
jgi:spermidine/putrescine transport system permease protein